VTGCCEYGSELGGCIKSGELGRYCNCFNCYVTQHCKRKCTGTSSRFETSETNSVGGLRTLGTMYVRTDSSSPQQKKRSRASEAIFVEDMSSLVHSVTGRCHCAEFRLHHVVRTKCRHCGQSQGRR
jgi:protein gp37